MRPIARTFGGPSLLPSLPPHLLREATARGRPGRASPERGKREHFPRRWGGEKEGGRDEWREKARRLVRPDGSGNHAPSHLRFLGPALPLPLPPGPRHRCDLRGRSAPVLREGGGTRIIEEGMSVKRDKTSSDGGRGPGGVTPRDSSMVQRQAARAGVTHV